jgi:uncharacterized protein HemX
MAQTYERITIALPSTRISDYRAAINNADDDVQAIFAETATPVTVAHQGTYFVDATAAPVSVDLPAAASSNGYWLTVKKTDASANAVTLDGNASETIDGATTYALSAQYDSVTVRCDGSEWFIVATV